MLLQQHERIRYSRQLPVIGEAGQAKLLQAKVLCVGAGGLGCPALQYLAAAGVGTLGIMDADTIELSNLQRQIVFNEMDVGANKAIQAASRLQAFNSSLTFHAYPKFLDPEDKHLISQYDAVIDATDNLEARYLLNTLCKALHKPLISASILQFEAQISVFNYQEGPCYQCLYPQPPKAQDLPNCSQAGVLGAVAGVVGSLQAAETIKVVLGKPSLVGKLLCINLATMDFKHYCISKNQCDQHPPINLNALKELVPAQLAQLLQAQADIQLIDVREGFERAICHIGGYHAPLSDLESHLQHLDKTKTTVIYCRSGVRSAQAGLILLEQGFEDVSNLLGGILAWQETIDPSLTPY